MKLFLPLRELAMPVSVLVRPIAANIAMLPALLKSPQQT
jgi:hypothetical protein